MSFTSDPVLRKIALEAAEQVTTDIGRIHQDEPLKALCERLAPRKELLGLVIKKAGQALMRDLGERHSPRRHRTTDGLYYPKSIMKLGNGVWVGPNLLAKLRPNRHGRSTQAGSRQQPKRRLPGEPPTASGSPRSRSPSSATDRAPLRISASTPTLRESAWPSAHGPTRPCRPRGNHLQLSGPLTLMNTSATQPSAAPGSQMVRQALGKAPSELRFLHEGTELVLAVLVGRAARHLDDVHRQFTDAAQQAATTLMRAVAGTTSINSLGVLQHSATQIDILAARRADAVDRLGEAINAYRQVTADKPTATPHPHATPAPSTAARRTRR
ncbi:hypothetical protein [Streptomyces prasinus]|uniref:hypothetical protein n=1 Tax=Streptomyces prasinus TaxID=67345 RepID=UPI003677F073